MANENLSMQTVNTSLNPQTTGTQTLSAEMKTFYSKMLLQRALANLVFEQLGEKVSIPRNGGKTVEFRQFSSFPKATTALTEGVTPNGTPVTVSAITKTLEQFGQYVTVTDVLDLTAIDNLIAEITSKLADSMSYTIDTIVRTELLTCSHVIYAPKSAGTAVATRSGLDATCKLTPAVIAKAVTTLKQQNAPKFDGSYIAVVHPSVAHDLMTDSNWIDVQKYSNVSTILNGELGKLYGVRFLESTEAPIFTGTGCPEGLAVYGCIFLGKGAFKVIDIAGAGAQIIHKGLGSGGTADPLDQRQTIGYKLPLFGAKLCIPDYEVIVECCSTFSATDTAN